jgi:hypothetical protein
MLSAFVRRMFCPSISSGIRKKTKDVLSEEKLDEISARLEHSQKYMICLTLNTMLSSFILQQF